MYILTACTVSLCVFAVVLESLPFIAQSIGEPPIVHTVMFYVILISRAHSAPPKMHLVISLIIGIQLNEY